MKGKMKSILYHPLVSMRTEVMFYFSKWLLGNNLLRSSPVSILSML